jgi:hypothetical protein
MYVPALHSMRPRASTGPLNEQLWFGEKLSRENEPFACVT